MLVIKYAVDSFLQLVLFAYNFCEKKAATLVKKHGSGWPQFVNFFFLQRRLFDE